MTCKRLTRRHGFTIVELVIIIAVIAILAAVLIPTFSTIIPKANESKDVQEARNAWSEVAMTYADGYRGFAADTRVINGWYYDYESGVAIYTASDGTTVTFDGENFAIAEYSADKARVWGAVQSATESYSGSPVGDAPYSTVLTFYDGVYSRGFSWITSPSVTDSKLYIVKGAGGADADFSSASVITGISDTSRAAYTSHKAWVTGLEPAQVYSYKVGSESGWDYGVFRTESASPASITAIQLSDAQTKNPDLLYVWENTMAQAIETAGHGLDMILYNGDQFDSNMTGIGASVDRGVRHAVSKETVTKYVGSLPYMASAGNHEPAASEQYIHVNNCTVDYGTKGDGGYSGEQQSGGYYSFDYAFAHFVVLNTNTMDDDQLNWLKSDLAAAQNAKWKIVMMHIGVYATGDHSDGSQVQGLITKLTPVFSQYHVDLVLQAHDHTYNKTLPYKWDAAGFTESYGDIAVVNFDVATTEYNGESYDTNPRGTYYVTTGAAGHRYGATEAKDGIWADVNDATGANVYPGYGYTGNKYKIEVGRITRNNSYEPYVYDGVTVDQVFKVGDYATGNVNANMFGVLNITEKTLCYDFYTVRGNEIRLFDTLRILKTN